MIREPVPDLRPRGVPADFCALLERRMAKEPGGRPRSALEFGRAIQELQRRNGAPVSPLVVEQLEDEVERGDRTATQPPPVGFGPVGVPSRTQPPQHTGRHTGQYPPHNTGQLPPPQHTGPRQPPPYQGGPQPPFPGPGPGYGQGGRAAGRRPWLWPVLAAAVAAVVVAGVLFIPGLISGARQDPGARLTGSPTSQLGAPADGDSSDASGGATSDPGSGSEQPPRTDLEPLLLQFTDFAPGGGELDSPPDGDIASILFCSRTAPQDGKIAEAKRTIAPPYEEGYQVDTYVAAFSSGAAETFMNGLQETTVTCAESTSLDEPQPFDPPPGGEQAVRVTATNREVIWVRYRDYVVKIEVSFSSGNDVKDETAPDIAARAIAKVMQGVSS